MPFGCFNEHAGTFAISPNAVPPKVATIPHPVAAAASTSFDFLYDILWRAELDANAHPERRNRS